MKNFRLFRAAGVVSLSAIPALAIIVALLTVAAAPLAAQSAGTAIGISLAPPPHKGVWLKAEVVHADARSMIVREQGNPLSIHTFTYAEPIQAPMQKIAEAGGYQYGDHVNILYLPGGQVALKIHGKPSKPS
jgi:hypothetical protein